MASFVEELLVHHVSTKRRRFYVLCRGTHGYYRESRLGYATAIGSHTFFITSNYKIYDAVTGFKIEQSTTFPVNSVEDAVRYIVYVYPFIVYYKKPPEIPRLSEVNCEIT